MDIERGCHGSKRAGASARQGDGIVAEKSYFDSTPQENYALFLNALAGLEDDAGIECYSQEGIRLLREALQEFRSDYRIRHGS